MRLQHKVAGASQNRGRPSRAAPRFFATHGFNACVPPTAIDTPGSISSDAARRVSRKSLAHNRRVQ